jgi:hypothetical protein
VTDFIDFGLSPKFSVEVLHDDEDHGAVSYCYPGGLKDAWVPGVSLRISPASEDEWVGSFLRGKESPNGIDLCCLHPDGERLVVVSRGAGYIVSPRDPQKWEEIPFRPIVGYVFDSELMVLAMIDYTRVIGIGAKGYLWKTPSLSWDGFEDVKLSNGSLVGKGWDAAASRFVPFEVRLSDGAHNGGSSPPGTRQCE